MLVPQGVAALGVRRNRSSGDFLNISHRQQVWQDVFVSIFLAACCLAGKCRTGMLNRARQLL